MTNKTCTAGSRLANLLVKACAPKRAAPSTVRALRARLGRLAPLWLCSEESPGAMPQLLPGESGILLELNRKSSILRAGLILPVKWMRCEEKDCRVPTDLAVVANDARSEAISDNQAKFASREQEIAGWRLCLGDGCPDLSACSNLLTFDSAGALLYALFVAALNGEEADGAITASACLGSAVGFGPVKGLGAKAVAAREIGISHVAVSARQTELPHPSVAAPALPVLVGKTRLEQANTLLSLLSIEPHNGTLDANCHWYKLTSRRELNVVPQARRAPRFYSACIAKAIADLQRAGPGSHPPTGGTLFTFSTGQPEVIALAVAYHAPRTVVLLKVLPENDAQSHGPDDTAAIEECVRHVPIPQARFVPCVVPARVNEAERILDWLPLQHRANITDGGAPFAVDLTGGTKALSMALYLWADANSIPKYLIASTMINKVTDPMSSRVVRVPDRERIK